MPTRIGELVFSPQLVPHSTHAVLGVLRHWAIHLGHLAGWGHVSLGTAGGGDSGKRNTLSLKENLESSVHLQGTQQAFLGYLSKSR